MNRLPCDDSLPSKEARKEMGQLMDECRGFALIYAAARIDLADHLSSGPLTLEELAEFTFTQADYLQRFLRVLVQRDILCHQEDGRYALTKLGACLRECDESDLKGQALVQGEINYPGWLHLVHTLRTGETAVNSTLGMTYFDYCAAHPEISAAVNRQMARGSRAISQRIVDVYDFTRFSTVVDIGGGVGTMLAYILDMVPKLRGILFDRPEVIEQSIPYLQEQGALERCSVVGGSFFEKIPAGGSAYLLKWILHDWSDTDCLTILKCIRSVMSYDAILLIVEYIIPENTTRSPVFEADLSMMIYLGGRERTELEFRTLLSRSGFELRKIKQVGAGQSIIEAGMSGPPF